MITLAQLNALAPAEFAATLGGIFEHSPWVAQQAAAERPFSSRLQLLDSMRAAVDEATLAAQLALIRAHPKLGVRGPSVTQLTTASAGEQRRAGLHACAPADDDRLQQLNALYLERFGFPFILAVRGHDPASIIANLERRLRNEGESERRTALTQIGAIAAYRLADLVASPPGTEILAMIERLAQLSASAAAAPGASTVVVREWMQAAGLKVCEPTGGNLIGRIDGGEPAAATLLAGVCWEPLVHALRYQGGAAFIIAIEAARQLRHKGERPALGLAVLARPDDGGLGDAGSLLDPHAPQVWVELSAADATDAQGCEILRALRAAQSGQEAVTLVRQGTAVSANGDASAFNAAAAEQAARALEESLRRVQTAA
ncbi:MAG: 2-oxo-4-hydroxy-4-carboxy-5-ureidoimidazoline decarboxylase [Steroidobacterales bacterium]